MIRILICGDRNWTDEDTIRAYIRYFKKKYEPYGGIFIIQGGARGADSIAGKIASELAIPSQEVKADWKKYGRGAGPIRNRLMLTKYMPHIVVAFHLSIETSKGTKNMISIAEKAGVKTILVNQYGYEGEKI